QNTTNEPSRLENIETLFSSSLATVYSTVVEKVTKPAIPLSTRIEPATHLKKGRITRYFVEKNFGFLRGQDGTQYFFHRTAITDDKLIEQLRNGTAGLEVTYEHTDGPKGPIAVAVSLVRSVKQIFELAQEYARD